MKTLFLSIFLFCSIQLFAQTKTEKQIISILKIQDEAWNNGDINGFMETYWKHDSLMFIGKSGVTYGWQNTLNNYKKVINNAVSQQKHFYNCQRFKRGKHPPKALNPGKSS